MAHGSQGTVGEGFLCHKPCTVSGGGNEISKPLTDAIVSGPVFVADWEKDMALAKEVIEKDYSIDLQTPTSTRSKQVYPQFEPFAWLGHQITDSSKLFTPAISMIGWNPFLRESRT